MGVESNKPLFSIVTVCYNSEKTIERTIESVLKQNFLNYEYIIIDGDSKDGTIDIVKSYESSFNGRMKWVSEPDKGIYDAFNKGIARSNGRYVWIVNSDDFIQQDSLQYLSEIVIKYRGEEPIISCALNYIDEKNGKIIAHCFHTANKAEKCYKMDSVGVVHPATVVPKSVYEKYGYYDDRFRIIADCDWFHRIYKKGANFLFIDRVITNMSNGGISGQWNLKRYKISFCDRKIYYKNHYSCLTERMLRFLLWNFHYVSIMVRNKIK